ncbi:hypothetical protein [Thalassomonas actiniarum]|uniref:Uncharacterized protein n=1 Tax=Thalassomonas actiniarum TaxID=485447 RepID=A0AAF0C3V6_9GAMM|nr:hypothetical protein [Thalassomonas actiniarum]WDD99967.1 hypothetical protein SG35_004710 [Thalassomonas actiniarum]
MVLSLKSKLLISGGVIAFAAAIWHLLCIWGGPAWFAFARAPEQIIESARQGTLLAPVGTLVVAGLMFACTLFAFSATGLIRKLPLLTPALITIALLCTVRGIIAVPFFLTPGGFDLWEVIASSVWLYVGICFIAGSVEHLSVVKVKP